MPFEWNKANLIRFIEKIREHPVIWNPKDEDYKCKDKRLDSFNSVASEFNIPRDEVERKWRVLQTQFRRASSKNGENPSRWFGYKHLIFLKGIREPRGPKDANNHEQASRSNYDNHGFTVAVHSSQDNSAQFDDSTLKPGLRKQVKWSDEQSDNKAIDLLRDFADNCLNKDSVAIYSEHIANKMRKYDPYTQAEVEHKINCILHEADMKSLWKPNAGGSRHAEYTALSFPGNSTSPRVFPRTSSTVRGPANSPEVEMQTMEPSSEFVEPLSESEDSVICDREEKYVPSNEGEYITD